MQPIIDVISNFILFLYQLTGNLGAALILFTLAIRSVLFPLTLSSLKAGNNIKKLQPELKELQKKHKGDKTAMQQAQMDLYKKYNVNPLAGCLPQLLQIGVLIVLYQVLVEFLAQSEIHGIQINPSFLWLQLNHPDPTYILPVLAGVTQLILSLMIAPGAEKTDEVPNQSKKKKVQEENKKEEDFAEMAQSMQQQMIFIMPVMTGILALQFPAGLSLYWVITTLFSIGQQWYVSGWGGLVMYLQRIQNVMTQKRV
jgi:YidC/Oxa1 family membrane protein insertase